ncbi:MAG: hypothetical protein AAFX76_11480 [Planctomycetota bacterium]
MFQLCVWPGVLGRRTAIVFPLGLVSLLPNPTSGQTNTGLLTDPWDEAPRGRAFVDTFGQSTSDDVNGDSFNLVVGRTKSRWALASAPLDANPRAGGPLGIPVFGHELVVVDLGGEAPGRPPRLVRQEAALGLPLGEVTLFGGPWQAGAALGFGHASSNPHGDDQGWYGLGSVFAQRPLPDGATLLIGLIHDGNRSVLPDVPLPIVAYRRSLGDTGELGLTIGYPQSRVIYRPDRRLTFSAGIDRLDVFTGEARYQLEPAWEGFVQYAAFYDQFHDADANNDRFFLFSQRVEAGVVWAFADGLRARVSGGYAFGQELRRGFDFGSTDRVLEFDDAPFLRVGGSFRF